MITSNQEESSTRIQASTINGFNFWSPFTEQIEVLADTPFRLIKKGAMTDVIDIEGGFGAFYLINSRFLDILRENKIKGFSVLEPLMEEFNYQYYLFIVNSYAGPISNRDSDSYKNDNKREFDIKTWDGSDIFLLKDTLVCVCTEKVKTILENEKVTNLLIRPL